MSGLAVITPTATLNNLKIEDAYVETFVVVVVVDEAVVVIGDDEDVVVDVVIVVAVGVAVGVVVVSSSSESIGKRDRMKLMTQSIVI